MDSDPILREVHRMKDQFARQYDYDLGKIIKRLKEDEKEHPERMARLVPGTPIPAKRRTSKRKTAE